MGYVGSWPIAKSILGPRVGRGLLHSLQTNIQFKYNKGHPFHMALLTKTNMYLSIFMSGGYYAIHSRNEN